jgi:hypothetical protein
VRSGASARPTSVNVLFPAPLSFTVLIAPQQQKANKATYRNSKKDGNPPSFLRSQIETEFLQFGSVIFLKVDDFSQFIFQGRHPAIRVGERVASDS